MELHCNTQSVSHINIPNLSPHHKGLTRSKSSQISSFTRVKMRMFTFYTSGLRSSVDVKMREVKYDFRKDMRRLAKGIVFCLLYIVFMVAGLSLGWQVKDKIQQEGGEWGAADIAPRKRGGEMVLNCFGVLFLTPGSVVLVDRVSSSVSDILGIPHWVQAQVSVAAE